MTIDLRRLTGALVLSIAASGCDTGTNPLVGQWFWSVGSPGAETERANLELDDDGTATYDYGRGMVNGSPCGGGIQASQITWTSTATTITFGGTDACTGSIACNGEPSVDCSGKSATGMAWSGWSGQTCTYAIDSTMETLTLSGCVADGIPVVYKR